MNATLIRIGVLLALSGMVGAAESQVRVAASRDLRLAVIDPNKLTAAREIMHQAFATALGASLTTQCRGPVGVRAKRVGPDHAAFNLSAGVYDAVLVISRDVPGVFRRVDAITLSATPDNEKRERSIYLLIGNGDASLQGLLATGFTQAVNDGEFLRHLAAAEGKLAPASGESVAVH